MSDRLILAERPTSRSPDVMVSRRVREAIEQKQPVVSLETAVATHGLPAPHNVGALSDMAREIESKGVVPAICVVDRGQLVVGAELDRIQALTGDPQIEKLSVRDVGRAVALGRSGGLTVSGTLLASELAGITVFATGGIGGVHLGSDSSWDVSSDLQELSRRRTVTVCAGAKSVLDLPRTLEVLETLGVPVLGFGTSTFPAFFLRTSGLSVNRIASPGDIAAVALAHWSLGSATSVVVANPLSEDDAVSPGRWTYWLNEANETAHRAGITGQAVTPFLLDHIVRSSKGETVRANLTLLRHNAALAADIAI
ncbi:MAG TPA: pseudouridine-5'-phosphate glycosidase, partial [Chloroflexota bacterium]